MRRGRAADAKDPDAIVRQHVPGSRDTHGIFDGTIEEFGEYLRTHNYSDPRYGPQRHLVSQPADRADLAVRGLRRSRYHIAYHRIELPVGLVTRSTSAVDISTAANWSTVRWLLASRTVIYDWSRSSRPAELTTRSHA